VPEAPPKEVFPVLGATPAVIGSLQVIEALKYLTGVGEPLKEKLLVWEGARTRFTQVRFRKDPECATCGSAHE
jgi:adenylyltransferase/sulfurtransferase